MDASIVALLICSPLLAAEVKLGPEIALMVDVQYMWEDAATAAVKKAGESLRGLRVAEVVEQDLDIGEGGTVTFRTKLSVSFKYEGGT